MVIINCARRTAHNRANGGSGPASRYGADCCAARGAHRDTSYSPAYMVMAAIDRTMMTLSVIGLIG